MTEEANRGRCVTCGYLCRKVANSYATDEVYAEADLNLRHEGDLFNVSLQGRGYEKRAAEPHCFRNKVDLMAGVRQVLGDAEKYLHVSIASDSKADAHIKATNVLRRSINEPRDCPWWREYEPGLSPTAHRDAEKAECVETDRRRFEERMEARREHFERRMERIRRRWELRREKERNRVEGWLAWAALALAAMQVLTMTADSYLARFVMWFWHRIH